MSQRKLLSFLLPGLLLVALGVALVAGSASAQTPTPEPGATATPSPTPSPTPGPVAITLNPAQRALSCSASTVVTVNVTVGGAAAPNGTQVTLAANPGTVAPVIVQTSNGAAAFTYFSPAAGSGVATLSATSLATSGSVQISLFCGVGPGGGQVPGAVIQQPVVQCFGGGANATFSWTPVAGADVQYVDLSLANNGFAGGTFIGFGPLAGTTAAIQWNGLLPGQTHYWRVSAGLPGVGWAFSQTGSFTPCGPTAPVGGTSSICTGNGRANVTWNISNAPLNAVVSYVDITIFDNGFAPGTFIGSNATGQQSFTWQGILANTTHYWRINHLTGQGWIAGSTGSFNATC